ncbi:MAG TPA: hypothetical protein VLL76_05960 [Candidatus Omnitrophota bacterium]|nr:hypothetical protein [Candidatus Omnitrophota bacterium]
MPKKPAKKAAPPKKQSATDKMIAECVKRAQARKRSGQTDREWREQYAASLKVEGDSAPMSKTPFDGEATKKKVG